MKPPPSVDRSLRTASRVDRRAHEQRRREARPRFTKNPGPLGGDTCITQPKQGSVHGDYSLYSSTGVESDSTDLPDYGATAVTVLPEAVEAEHKLDKLAELISSFDKRDPRARQSIRDDGESSCSEHTIPDTRETPQHFSRKNSDGHRMAQPQAVDTPTNVEALVEDRVAKVEEAAHRKIAIIEDQVQQHKRHTSTCLTTLHCLVSELREVCTLVGTGGEESDITEQLFSDIGRLLRSLAFGSDGTFEEGDSLAAATLLENRSLRAKLRGKERELSRHQNTIRELKNLGKSMSKAETTIRTLDFEHRNAINRSMKLEEELDNLSNSHSHCSARLEEFERRDQEFASQVQEWQALIDKAVVEAQLMKAHADGLVDSLEEAKAEVHQQRRIAAIHAEDAASLKRQVDQLEKEVADLNRELRMTKLQENLNSTVQTMEHSQESEQHMCNTWQDEAEFVQKQTDFQSNMSTPGMMRSWTDVVDELEADRASARDELSRIDGEIDDLQASLKELTGRNRFHRL